MPSFSLDGRQQAGVPNKYFLGCRIQPVRGALVTPVQLVGSATCDFWTLKRDSCIKRYPSGVCPSPARETAPGFSLRGREAPQNALGFLGPDAPGAPNGSVFWPPPPRTPNPKTSRGMRRMPQFRKGQSGNPAGRPPGSRNRATSMVQNLLEGKHCQACRPAGRGGQRGRHPHLHEPPLAGRPA